MTQENGKAVSAFKTSPTSPSSRCWRPRIHWGNFVRQIIAEPPAVYDGPSRKRMRYDGHDYRAPCTVHVTICTHHHQRLFGVIDHAGLHLNDAGQFAAASLLALHADGVAIDTHIVMPDHIHAIIVLGTNPEVETGASVPLLVEAFKMRLFKSWPTGIRRGGWQSYDTHLWQRSYYDTLIRNDRHLEKTRAYILANPDRWIARLESDPSNGRDLPSRS